MSQTRIDYLLQQFNRNGLDAEELEELNLLVTQQPEQFEEQIAITIAGQRLAAAGRDAVTEAETFRKIMAADKPVAPVKAGFFNRYRLWLGAAAVLCVFTGSYLILKHNQQKNTTVAVNRELPEKSPGRNTAILTLDDNTTVDLGENSNKLIGTQGRSAVLLKDGKLSYQQQSGVGPATVYNRLNTPRGGEFTITLSDGTVVWLNASSMLRFPASFTGATREVELLGEAYFEVAPDKKHPFEVVTKGSKVQVLGTEFNIMGYEDEAATVTTLVQGAVQVSLPGQAPRLLTPGEHAVVKRDDGDIEIKEANVQEETAWKNGRTYFDGADIRQIMRQISRWYDVDVKYEGVLSHLKFTCTVSRKDKLSKLLKLLEMTGTVHFSMEGNVIIVHS